MLRETPFLIFTVKLVNNYHGLLQLFERSLPITVIRFLISRYSLQRLKVQWNLACFCEPFTVSNIDNNPVIHSEIVVRQRGSSIMLCTRLLLIWDRFSS